MRSDGSLLLQLLQSILWSEYVRPVGVSSLQGKTPSGTRSSAYQEQYSPVAWLRILYRYHTRLNRSLRKDSRLHTPYTHTYTAKWYTHAQARDIKQESSIQMVPYPRCWCWLQCCCWLLVIKFIFKFLQILHHGRKSCVYVSRLNEPEKWKRIYIYIDLSYTDPQSWVLNHCFKW